jgi:apolipoprotein N-acyltransferase
MFQHLIRKASYYYLSGNRWWLPLAAGCLYSLALPPFNHETHWSLSLFPLLNFVVLIPLFAFAVHPSLKKSVLHSYLYGYTAALGQYHWLIFDKVDGLWHLVIIGLFLISAIIGVLYLVAGLLFRITLHHFPKAYFLIFPALWTIIDYSRTLGDIAFPWAFLGYSLTPILPIAQLASFTGVWGLTFVIVAGNTLVWELLKCVYYRLSCKKIIRFMLIVATTLCIASVAGWFRLHHFTTLKNKNLKISLLQSNIDQLHWNNNMLDTAFAVTESLIVKAAGEKPALMILPESALLCYIAHRHEEKGRLLTLIRRVKIPLIFGSLDWEQAPSGSGYDYHVFNTAFFVDTVLFDLIPYHKIQLVPFSEVMPFEGLFPVLSRVNLGEADFHRGKELTIFQIGSNLKVAPFICYESIFPDFVRQRVRKGANLMVQITNDGWFGKSSGPYHHAIMARMRSIENGISLARCANSGISMAVDPLGRVFGRTGLYERTILTLDIPWYVIPTPYTKLGDWFVVVCGVIISAALMMVLLKKHLHNFSFSG